jgi:hypothetical protein
VSGFEVEFFAEDDLLDGGRDQTGDGDAGADASADGGGADGDSWNVDGPGGEAGHARVELREVDGLAGAFHDGEVANGDQLFEAVPGVKAQQMIRANQPGDAVVGGKRRAEVGDGVKGVAWCGAVEFAVVENKMGVPKDCGVTHQ